MIELHKLPDKIISKEMRIVFDETIMNMFTVESDFVVIELFLVNFLDLSGIRGKVTVQFIFIPFTIRTSVEEREREKRFKALNSLRTFCSFTTDEFSYVNKVRLNPLLNLHSKKKKNYEIQ